MLNSRGYLESHGKHFNWDVISDVIFLKIIVIVRG